MREPDAAAFRPPSADDPVLAEVVRRLVEVYHPLRSTNTRECFLQAEEDPASAATALTLYVHTSGPASASTGSHSSRSEKAG